MTNIKIIIAISITFLFTFSLLIIFEKIYEDDIKPVISKQEIINSNFFSSNFSSNRTVFLIGSSHVGQLNVTKINDIISSNNDPQIPISVYNLAMSGNTPTNEIKYADLIISSHPEIIFYGISYWDFLFPVTHVSTNYLLPDLKLISSEVLSSSMGDLIPSNPQLITRMMLRTILFDELEDDKKIALETIPKTPFFKYSKNPTIMSKQELKTTFKSPPTWNNQANQYRNMNALHDFISSMKENNIEIVIFLTPLQKYYLESLSESQVLGMDLLIDDLSKKYGIEVYDFREKYSELNIWSDPTHVSHHQNVTQYVNDVSDIIIENMN